MIALLSPPASVAAWEIRFGRTTESSELEDLRRCACSKATTRPSAIPQFVARHLLHVGAQRMCTSPTWGP